MTGILPATPVINEIHYNNDVNYIANEFVEIYNPGPDLVNLSGWQLTGGVEFTFPHNTLLGANNYVAVAEIRPPSAQNSRALQTALHSTFPSLDLTPAA